MKIMVWITEGTWQACVDAAVALAPADAEVALLYVTSDDIPGAAHGAFAGLLGRGHPSRDPGTRLAQLTTAAADELLHAAADRLGRPAERLRRNGRVEREVITATDDADLLILARDGDRDRLGPRSLGPATRFVVDHAPCQVLLVWPSPAPDTTSLPPPPPHHR